MKKSKLLIVIMLICAALFITACGTDKDEAKDDDMKSSENKDKNEKENDDKDDEDKEKDEDKDEKAKDEDDEKSKDEDEKGHADNPDLKKDLDDITSFMEDETDGTANVLFDNLNAENHELEDFTVTLEG